MDEKKLKKALSLLQRIKDLTYFLERIVPTPNNTVRNIACVIKIKTEKSISVFGSRSFGIGEHTQEILFPPDDLDLLIEIVEHRLEKLKIEYEKLYK